MFIPIKILIYKKNIASLNTKKSNFLLYCVIFLRTKILGIDLSGKDGNPTGFCLIINNIVLSIGTFRTLKALLDYINILNPTLVSIDAPLNFSQDGHFRDCDILLKKSGLSPLPLNTPSMISLIKRAITLTQFLKSKKITYIETFPAGAIRLLGYRKKPKNKNERRQIFMNLIKLFDLATQIDSSNLTKDEFDAFLCALSGYAYINNRYVEFKGNECTIILPSKEIE